MNKIIKVPGQFAKVAGN